MEIHKIEAGNFKLDGGAMFGVVPKSLWSRKKTSDENNMCSWSMRCMLVDYGDRLVLIDTGMGDKQSEKFFSYYYPHGDDSLLKSIKEKGYSPDEITDVVLTHLHFDHCGGAVSLDRSKDRYFPTFPSATYWSSERHWKWATNPNDRESASFLKENILPLQEAGQLSFVEREGRWSKGELFPGFKLFFADGHTESQMIPYITYKGKTVIYAADLLPSAAHVPMPWVMGYDVRPLETLKEKRIFLDSAAAEEHVIFLEHDLDHECATVHHTEKGIRLKDTYSFSEIFG